MTTSDTAPAGGETRHRLLEAGLKLFGLHGYEATATRALAAEAGANLGSILYHFGGKEGLYRAVVERALAEKVSEVEPCLLSVRAVCADPASARGRLEQALEQLISTMVEVMIGNPKSQAFSQIMIQEQIAPTPAYDLLYEGFFDRVNAVWRAVLSRLTGLPEDSTELRLRTIAVMGQFIIFRLGMTAILKQLGCARLTQEHLDAIARIGLQQVRAIIASTAQSCGGNNA